MHDRQANGHTKRFPAIYFLENTRTKLLAMPPKKSTRQNSNVAESEDVIEPEVSRPAFQAKDATQWMMFMSGKAIFRVRPQGVSYKSLSYLSIRILLMGTTDLILAVR